MSRVRPDLLLIDLNLPGLDGLGLCRRLREDPSTAHLPIILTAAEIEDPQMAGVVDGLIRKPINRNLL